MWRHTPANCAFPKRDTASGTATLRRRTHGPLDGVGGDDRRFGGSEGHLVDRLLDALDAAESEGGDARGRQSAAILVLPGRDWDPSFDLRVEDSPEPLQELRRLVTLQRCYIELNHGDRLMAGGEFEDALASYERA
jgi:Family of unknown function (DUF1028)